MNVRPLTARPGSLLIALAASGVLAACTGEQGGATKTTGQTSVPAGDAAPATGQPASALGARGAEGMGGMKRMEGMSGMGGGMMERMPAHMRMMGSAAADRMRAMLPMHRQTAANMLS